MPAGRFYHAEGAAGRLPEEIIGKTVWQANPIVIEILKSHGALLGAGERSSTAIRTAGAATTRPSSAPPSSGSSAWTATIFASARSNAIKDVKWMPAWGEERMSNMIATRPDWCISRQRVWGVPIIVFYCESCREPLTDRKVLDRVVDAVPRAHRRHLVRTHGRRTAGRRCTLRASAAAREFRKETDILDVWFDSGSSHLAVLTERTACPGRPTCIWKAAISIAAGSTVRCWWASALQGRSALSRVRHQRLGAR